MITRANFTDEDWQTFQTSCRELVRVTRANLRLLEEALAALGPIPCGPHDHFVLRAHWAEAVNALERLSTHPLPPPELPGLIEDYRRYIARFEALMTQ